MYEDDEFLAELSLFLESPIFQSPPEVFLAPAIHQIVRGRSGVARHHIGNFDFLHRFLRAYDERYRSAHNGRKRVLAREILDRLRDAGYQFIEYSKVHQGYIEINNDRRLVNSIMHSMRDAIKSRIWI
ncbi:unnamed protein product [Cylindrotheca closterium]|uniref:DUF6824 domain-containing protein n=1 Tax=Cylindrotheca closterium TaxID=2856 RepID=A0AAD2FNG3_9STRA|nr:unnamed protein product [Cylindrotheca closterium]